MLKTNLKKAVSATAEFVEDHKVAIAITGTFVATTFAATLKTGSGMSLPLPSLSLSAR